MLGLPTRPAFWKDSRPRAELREELGLEVDAPTAMVMGGGDGVGGMGAIATAVIDTLARELDQCQASCFCWGGLGRGVKSRFLLSFCYVVSCMYVCVCVCKLCLVLLC